MSPSHYCDLLPRLPTVSKDHQAEKNLRDTTNFVFCIMIHAMYLIYFCTNTIYVLTHTTDTNLYTTSIARSAWYKQPALAGWNGTSQFRSNRSRGPEQHLPSLKMGNLLIRQPLRIEETSNLVRRKKRHVKGNHSWNSGSWQGTFSFWWVTRSWYSKRWMHELLAELSSAHLPDRINQSKRRWFPPSSSANQAFSTNPCVRVGTFQRHLVVDLLPCCSCITRLAGQGGSLFVWLLQEIPDSIPQKHTNKYFTVPWRRYVNYSKLKWS